MSLRHPVAISVIVPVRDDARNLALSLAALEASDLPREEWELIVVDDASTDDSVAIAAHHADTVMRLPDESRGPAYARNRGIEVATGELVAFVDSDVSVRPDTLRLLRDALQREPDLAAVSCTYDRGSRADGFASGYRHLLLHHLQQGAAGSAIFISSCAMARRAVLQRAGMFDEWCFPRAQVEDLELGTRLRALGQRLALRADLQVQHRRRWTVGSALAADVRDRAVPFMRVLGRSYQATDAERPRFSTATPVRTLAFALLLVALLAAWTVDDRRFLIAAGALFVMLLAANARLFALFVRARGPFFALAAAPVHVVFEAAVGIAMGAGWLMYHLVGDPRPSPTLEAFAEVGVRTWPPVPTRPAPESPPSAPSMR